MNNNVLIKIKEEVLAAKEVKEFCIKNKLSDNEINSNLIIFRQYLDSLDICNKCQGKQPCQLDPVNYQLELGYDSMVSLKYLPCKYKEEDIYKYLELICFPKEYKLDELTPTPARTNLYKAIKEYQKNPLVGKGIYLYGKFGTGKTFVFYSMAVSLAKKKIHVALVNYPDFCCHLKFNITNDGEVEKLIDKCKTIDVLVLDDIGGEVNSAFLRDDVLFAILQYRIIANKPVFMTSNYSVDELEEHFKEDKNSINATSASRIIERIKRMTNIIELTDKNYRVE